MLPSTETSDKGRMLFKIQNNPLDIIFENKGKACLIFVIITLTTLLIWASNQHDKYSATVIVQMLYKPMSLDGDECAKNQDCLRFHLISKIYAIPPEKTDKYDMNNWTNSFSRGVNGKLYDRVNFNSNFEREVDGNQLQAWWASRLVKAQNLLLTEVKEDINLLPKSESSEVISLQIRLRNSMQRLEIDPVYRLEKVELSVERPEYLKVVFVAVVLNLGFLMLLLIGNRGTG